ncbi:MAG: hypothetical protein ACPGJE_06665 [Wenzhouxiangellaceae bacterium]
MKQTWLQPDGKRQPVFIGEANLDCDEVRFQVRRQASLTVGSTPDFVPNPGKQAFDRRFTITRRRHCMMIAQIILAHHRHFRGPGPHFLQLFRVRWKSMLIQRVNNSGSGFKLNHVGGIRLFESSQVVEQLPQNPFGQSRLLPVRLEAHLCESLKRRNFYGLVVVDARLRRCLKRNLALFEVLHRALRRHIGQSRKHERNHRECRLPTRLTGIIGHVSASLMQRQFKLTATFFVESDSNRETREIQAKIDFRLSQARIIRSLQACIDHQIQRLPGAGPCANGFTQRSLDAADPGQRIRQAPHCGHIRSYRHQLAAITS